MLNVAAPIWNEIAKIGTTSKFGSTMFPLSQDELTQAHQRQADRLEKQGYSPKVVTAFLQYAPLIAERDSVAAYRNSHPEAATFLPELNTVQEALWAARREFLLNARQEAQLEQLLLAL